MHKPSSRDTAGAPRPQRARRHQRERNFKRPSAARLLRTGPVRAPRPRFVAAASRDLTVAATLVTYASSVLAALLVVVPTFGAEKPSSAQSLPLFNGTNLAGWYSWLVDTKRDDPRRVFTVTNGMLRISGDGLGYLSTEQEYSDFRLVVEYQWGATNRPWGERLGKASDSGLFLHSIGPDGNSHDGRGAFRAAIECQIMQGATGDFLLIRGTNADGSLIAPRVSVAVHSERDAEGWPFVAFAGPQETIERWGRVNWVSKSRQWKDEFDFRGPRDLEKPRGQWNELVCVCRGDDIMVRLNGVKVNEAHRVFPERGKILLQCEGSEIYFRRVALERISRR